MILKKICQPGWRDAPAIGAYSRNKDRKCLFALMWMFVWSRDTDLDKGLDLGNYRHNYINK
jgi:hypothetical protein